MFAKRWQQVTGRVLRNGVLAVLAVGLLGGVVASAAMPVEGDAGSCANPNNMKACRLCEDYGSCISCCWALSDEVYDKCTGRCKDKFRPCDKPVTEAPVSGFEF